MRRESHEQNHVGYESKYIISLTWHPEPDAANKAAAMFVDGREEVGIAARNLTRFKATINDIEDRLTSVVKARRLVDTIDEHDGMVTSEILAHLQGCVSLSPRNKFKMGEVPMYLDAVLGQLDFVTGFEPRVGERQMIAIGINGFPASSFPGILDFLSRLAIEYRWSNRFINIDTRDADRVLNGYRSKWAQKRKSIMNLLRENNGGQATHINLDADMIAYS